MSTNKTFAFISILISTLLLVIVACTPTPSQDSAAVSSTPESATQSSNIGEPAPPKTNEPTVTKPPSEISPEDEPQAFDNKSTSNSSGSNRSFGASTITSISDTQKDCDKSCDCGSIGCLCSEGETKGTPIPSIDPNDGC